MTPQTALKERIVEDLDRLTADQLERVHGMVHALAVPRPRGASVHDLMSLGGSINDESARQMTAVIDEAFERIDPFEW